MRKEAPRWEDAHDAGSRVDLVAGGDQESTTLPEIHIHLVQFEVVGREDACGVPRGPEAWETGFKDTVIAYPGEITRVKARFDVAGLFVWHCHILEYEDNDMMRAYRVESS